MSNEANSHEYLNPEFKQAAEWIPKHLVTSGQPQVAPAPVTQPVVPTPSPPQTASERQPTTAVPAPNPVRVITGKPVQKSTPPKFAYLRDFPKPLLASVRALFPELENQTDVMVAFTLYSIGLDAGASDYQPPAHITNAVRRLRDKMDGAEMHELHATMGQLHKKLNRMDNQMQELKMLASYSAVVSSGLHAPGKVQTGSDLKFDHEKVISASRAASQKFLHYKKVIKDYEGRPQRDALHKIERGD